MPSSANSSSGVTPAAESRFEHAALFEFSRVINSSLDLKFILNHILLTIMGKIMASRGMVVLGDGGLRFTVALVKGCDTTLIGRTISFAALPDDMVDLAVASPPREGWEKSFSDAGCPLILPLVIADRTIGLLAFGGRLPGRSMTDQELSFLRSLTNISATAIEKALTVKELQQVNRRLDRKLQELNTLFDLSKEFGALLDPDKLVRLLVFSLLGQVGVSRYLICLRSGPDMLIAASKLPGQPPQSELLVELGRVRNPVLVPDMIVTGDVDPRPVLTALGISVVVPMQMHDENRGLILLGAKLSGEPFSEPDLEFLTSLGNLAIISLENARLFGEAIEKQKLEDELMIARDIQKGLLPNVLPVVPGFELCAANISSKQVGGDYYDAVALDGGRHILAIGDVSGKGTPAALLMANLQATIRALVPGTDNLAALTSRVNDLMCENTGGNKFVTFFWGILDPGQRTLRYVNAGHNYPYLMHANGTCDRLDKGGMILGIIRDTTVYDEGLVPLVPGDLLVMFTDGVSEAMSADQEEYGEERLEGVIRSVHSAAAREVMDAIHKDVLRHTRGAPQSDDLTMMILRAV
jgi:sigma-B regulation protein RsbU (phosphoserine phosphatase)